MKRLFRSSKKMWLNALEIKMGSNDIRCSESGIRDNHRWKKFVQRKQIRRRNLRVILRLGTVGNASLKRRFFKCGSRVPHHKKEDDGNTRSPFLRGMKICKGDPFQRWRRTEGTGCYHKLRLPPFRCVHSILSERHRRVFPANFYPGQASTDYCDDLVENQSPAIDFVMILGELDTEKQADVAKRIAMMDRTEANVIKEVERQKNESGILIKFRL